jgi:hypothetical protein
LFILAAGRAAVLNERQTHFVLHRMAALTSFVNRARRRS